MQHQVVQPVALAGVGEVDAAVAGPVVGARDVHTAGERARLDLYSSAHTMDDLDELRAFLNYGALNRARVALQTLAAERNYRSQKVAVKVARMYGVFYNGLSIGGSSINLMALIGGVTTIAGACLAIVICSSVLPPAISSNAAHELYASCVSILPWRSW